MTQETSVSKRILSLSKVSTWWQIPFFLGSSILTPYSITKILWKTPLEATTKSCRLSDQQKLSHGLIAWYFGKKTVAGHCRVQMFKCSLHFPFLKLPNLTGSGLDTVRTCDGCHGFVFPVGVKLGEPLDSIGSSWKTIHSFWGIQLLYRSSNHFGR